MAEREELRALCGVECDWWSAADVISTIKVGAESVGILLGEAVVLGGFGQHVDEVPNVSEVEVHVFVDICQGEGGCGCVTGKRRWGLRASEDVGEGDEEVTEQTA